MNIATNLDIIASCLGFFSALFFSIGVLHFKPSRADEIATKMWNKGLAISEEMLSQKADFIVGAFLLVLSFLLQFVLKVFPESFAQTAAPNHTQGVVIAVAVSVAIATVCRIVGSLLGKGFLRQLQTSTKGKL